MDASLADLLRRTKDQSPTGLHKRGDSSHVIWVPQQQFVTIRRECYNEFWEGYCRIVYKGDGLYSLAENTDRDMPVTALFNFQFNNDDINDDDIFSDQFLLELVYVWQKAIEDKLQLSEAKTELICVALESNHCFDDADFSYFQVRLQFPFCRTDANLIPKIREYAISLLRRRNSLKLLAVAPVNDWERMLDAHAHHEPLTMYKGVKVSTRPFMVLSNIFGVVTEDHLAKEEAPFFELHQVFRPEDHSFVAQGLLSADIFDADFDADKRDILFWLPLFLSVHFSTARVMAKIEDKRESPFANRNTSKTVVRFDEQATDLEKARFFLQLIKQERADDIFSWKDIGRALFTASNGGDDGLEEWISFSSKSDSFDDEDCIENYSRFEAENYNTYKTLAWFAKLDSPSDYEEWHKSWCQEALEKALDLFNISIADYIYRLYWLEVACVDGDKSNWYVFNGNYWTKKQKSIVLADRINKDIIPKLEVYRMDLSQQVHMLTNPVEKKPFEIKIKAIGTLIQQLSNYKPSRCILNSAIVPFHVEYENFLNFADQNHRLMGFLDCVTEVDGKSITLRKGKPEDYITMVSKVRVMRGFHWEHPLVKEVMDWIKRIHVDNELRHEFLKEVASMLRGRNIDKRIPIWTGKSGNNSKSMFVRLMESAFGQYAGKFPTSIFTGRRTASSSANPELARSKGKHLMMCQETDEDVESFRKGIMKELSGSDTVFARMLHQDGGEFLPMFKLLVICNRVPGFIGGDDAIKDRVRIIPWLSQWTDSAPDDIDEQFKQRKFKRDPYFEEKIPMLAPAFVWVLVQYYPKYAEEGLKEPKIVKEYTKKYWEEQDYYTQFVDECIEFKYQDDTEEVDHTYTITHLNLFRYFKEWLKDWMMDTKSFAGINAKIAKDEFMKRFPLYEDRKWVGVRIVSEGEGDAFQDI